MPLEVFYGTLDTPLTRPEVSFARVICQACPVLLDCALTAMRDHEPFGVWAGSTPAERQEILRQHEGNIEQSATYLTRRVLQIGNNDDEFSAYEQGARRC